MVMEGVGFFYLLLCAGFLLASSEVLHVKRREGNTAVLRCGKLSKGNVTWSKEINGQKVDILNNDNGKVTRYSAGSDGRYSSGGNPWLNIFRVSQSDAGRYYCNGETVELTIIRTDGSTAGERVPGKPVFLKMVVAIVAVSFLVGMVLVLVLCCYFSRKKAEDKIELMYAQVHKPKK